MSFKLLALVAGVLPPVMRGSYLADSSSLKSFLEAAPQGNLDIVEEWIQKSADINCSLFNGDKALMYAALGGHLEVARLVIENGANVNQANTYGNVDMFSNTALMEASRYGHVAIAQMLIGNCANVNHVDFRSDTALVAAAHDGCTPTVQLLIGKGANVNHVNKFRMTALTMAARFDQVRFAESLIEYGANVNIFNIKGMSARMCRVLVLAGAYASTAHLGDRATLIDPIISPLRAIQKSLVTHKAYSDVLPTFHEGGIHPLQGFISFAFESLKNEIDYFGDSDIVSFLNDHEWSPTKIENVRSIIQQLL